MARKLYKLVEQEVSSTCPHLTREQANELMAYYHNLLRHPDRIPYYRHNWARRMMGIVAEILTLNGDIEILDVGCGLGTEAIFLASLLEGITVCGIDCHSPRLLTAKKRIAYYENVLNRQLRVSFHNADVLSIQADRRFDLIWAMESVSHIHPADAFTERLPNILKEGGIVGVSDSNALNPLMLLTVLRLRWKGIYLSETVLLNTGEVVKMVEENLFTPAAMERELISRGLRVKNRTLGGFFPSVVGNRPTIATRLNRLEDIFEKIPCVANLGAIYTVVAQRSV